MSKSSSIMTSPKSMTAREKLKQLQQASAKRLISVVEPEKEVRWLTGSRKEFINVVHVVVRAAMGVSYRIIPAENAIACACADF
jgi:hypothetical protein